MSPQEQPFVPHTRHPEPVLSTALNAAQGWKTCGIHATLMNPIFPKVYFLMLVLRTTCVDQKV
ncbi:MAG: hypothetical protein RSG93_10120, partial [Acinetobacter sp.]